VSWREAPNAKLSEEMVRAIRRASAAGKTLEWLQELYPEVTRRTLSDIIRNRTWRWVKG
jgi:hypothetical protein